MAADVAFRHLPIPSTRRVAAVPKRRNEGAPGLAFETGEPQKLPSPQTPFLRSTNLLQSTSSRITSFTPITSASRCKVRTRGITCPRSSRAIAVCVVPTLRASSACVHPSRRRLSRSSLYSPLSGALRRCKCSCRISSISCSNAASRSSRSCRVIVIVCGT